MKMLLLLLSFLFVIPAFAEAEDVLLSRLIDTDSNVMLEWVLDSKEFAKEPKWEGVSPLPTSIEFIVQKARDIVKIANPSEEATFRSISLRPPVKQLTGLDMRFVFIVEFDIGSKGRRVNTIFLMSGKVVPARRSPL